MSLQLSSDVDLNDAMSHGARISRRVERAFALFYQNSSGGLSDYTTEDPNVEFENAQIDHFIVKAPGNKKIRFSLSIVQTNTVRGEVNVHLLSQHPPLDREQFLGSWTFSPQGETDATQDKQTEHLHFSTPADCAALVIHFVTQALRAGFAPTDSIATKTPAII